MLIACDVDGVVADTAATVLRRINAAHGLNVQLRDLIEWDMRLTFSKFARDIDVDAFFSAPDLYDEVQPIDGAVAGVNDLRAAGHQVVYVTSCFAGTTEAKARWLQRHGFSPAAPRPRHFPLDFIVASDKYHVAANLLIEDRPHNVVKWASRRQRSVIMMLYPFNRQYAERPRNFFTPYEWPHVHFAMTWPEIVATVERLNT